MSYDIDTRKRWKNWQEAVNNAGGVQTAILAYGQQSKEIAFTVPNISSMKQVINKSTEWTSLTEFGSPVSDTDSTILSHIVEFKVTMKILITYIPFVKLNLVYRMKNKPNIFDNTDIQIIQVVQQPLIVTSEDSYTDVTWNIGFLNTLQTSPDPFVPTGYYTDPVTGEFKNERTNEIYAGDPPIKPYDKWKDYEMRLILTIRNPNYYTSS